jgi:hypothetical protein
VSVTEGRPGLSLRGLRPENLELHSPSLPGMV